MHVVLHAWCYTDACAVNLYCLKIIKPSHEHLDKFIFDVKKLLCILWMPQKTKLKFSKFYTPTTFGIPKLAFVEVYYLPYIHVFVLFCIKISQDKIFLDVFFLITMQYNI